MNEYVPFLMLACFAGVFYIGGLIWKEVSDAKMRHRQPNLPLPPRRRTTDSNEELTPVTRGSD